MIATVLKGVACRAAGPFCFVAALALAGALAVSRLEVGRLEARAAAAAVAEGRAVKAAAAVEARRIHETQIIEARAARALHAARETSRALARKVPIHVTSEADARCVVPVGFVRLHDAAVGGLSAIPDSAGGADDAASGVALSDVAGAVVENYGTARATAEQLKALQSWVEAMSKGGTVAF